MRDDSLERQQFIGVGKLVIRFVWDEKIAGSSPATYTRDMVE